MNRIQEIISLSLIIITIVGSQYLLYFVPISKIENRCGIVIDKQQPTTIDLHRYSADIHIKQTLYINFNGKIEAHDMDADSYYKHNKGSRICIEGEDKVSWPIGIIIIVGSLIGIIIDIAIIIFVIMTIWRLIGGMKLIDAIEDTFETVDNW